MLKKANRLKSTTFLVFMKYFFLKQQTFPFFTRISLFREETP